VRPGGDQAAGFHERTRVLVRAPRLRPTREFADALRRDGRPQIKLAVAIGFPAAWFISNLALRKWVKATPQTLGRIQALAGLIGFTGQVFVEKAPR
jgi:hypothetical protein